MDSTEAESTTLPSASHLSTTIMTDPSLPSSLPDLPDERNPRFSTPAASGLLADGAALLEAREVPSTYGGSIKAWWSYSAKKEAELTQERLLRKLPSFITSDAQEPEPTALDPNPLVARIVSYPLDPPASSATSLAEGGKKMTGDSARSLKLNGLAFWTAGPGGTKASGSKVANVLLHGYGAGLGLFFLNHHAFAEASAQQGRRGYALDWLGMGLSSRPSPKAFDGVKGEPMRARVERAEAFFVDSLERWRETEGVEKMTLLGHSLGGYLAAAYTLKYPERVDKLVMISPAGVPLNPNAPSTLEPVTNAPKEFTEPRSSTTKPLNKDDANSPRPRLRAAFGWAWEQGWSPFGVLRALGPLAPKVVGIYSTRRFQGLSELDVKQMHAYIYAISMAPGSGEYCISHLLAPGAFARAPLVERMDGITVPVTFIYGDKDWMDKQGGFDTCARLQRAGNAHSRTVVVPGAGHHVYLDNPPAFNALLHEELTASRP